MASSGEARQDPVHPAGGRRPVVFPKPNDPRLHLSLVTISLFVIGIGWLDFRLSLVQILAAMVPSALVEMAVTLRRTSTIVWPASALQTAASVALLLRVEGTPANELWSTNGWYYFTGIALAGLLTKYVVRFEGGHVFNPSNVALVVAFLVLGSERIEPLDLWWGPLGVAMVLAYAVIGVGGVLICRRLRLIEMGVAFWLTFAAGVGVLALVDHSITARWSFAPIAGTHFWWIVMTSPETLIFLFFMLTDPRTVPRGRTARILFAVTVAVLASLLVAPWETEFGAKVGLLSSLAIVSASRPLLERFLPAPGTELDDPRAFVRRLFGGGVGRPGVRVAAAVVAVAVFGGGVAAASLPSRQPVEADTGAAAAVPPVDESTLPAVETDRFIANLSDELATPEGSRRLAAELAWLLAVEHEALRTRDASVLEVVDHGYRLDDLQRVIDETGPDDPITAPLYQFDALRLMVVFPGGAQEGPNAGFVASGTVTDVEYGPGGDELAREVDEFAVTFAMRQTTSGRWQITDTLPVPK